MTEGWAGGSSAGGGWGNPVVGYTSLRTPAINSPNFNLEDPLSSPVPSWGVLQNGLAYFFGLILSGGTFAGPDYVINTSGGFFYNGAPASGNLLFSFATAPGTDAFGNAYQSGFTSYNGADSYGQLSGSQLIFESFIAPAILQIAVSDSGVLFVSGTPGESSFQVTVPISQPLYASDPVAGFGTAETWHPITLDTGWSVAAAACAPSYRLLPDGNLQLTGAVTFGSSQTTDHNLNNGHPLPAPYRPLTRKVYRSGDTFTARSAVQVSPTGVIEALGGAGNAYEFCEIDGIIALTL